ncbi:MAG: sugar nucleotide-binding protein, partial [Thermoanaerobaculia bacterium]
LARRPALQLTATARNEGSVQECRRRIAGVDWRAFDAASDATSAHAELLSGSDWVINAIGILKPLIRDDNAFEVERAVRINALLPLWLARATAGRARVLQIATDCTFSGSRGRYTEADSHDALDVYGKSKSLGEVPAAHVHHLRCSIVGPEAKAPKSLLEWVLGQPRGGTVNGFVNHRWNGVTSLHFAKLCAGIIESGLDLPRLQHIVPTGTVTKCELLQSIALRFDRADLTIQPTEAQVVVDRTLATGGDARNRALWTAAGHAEPPSVPQMIEELARFDYRYKPSAAVGDAIPRAKGESQLD